jgi:hypothetical protein
MLVTFFGPSVSHHSTDLEYNHLPDIATFDGVLDLLSACVLAILGNILDFQTYSAPNQDEDEQMSTLQSILMTQFDCNDIPSNEHMAVCYVRGVALSLCDWVRWRLVITPPDGHVLDDLPSRYLVQILKSVVNYKSKAMWMRLKGAPHCCTGTLRRQAANVVRCESVFESLWKDNEGIPDDNLTMVGKDSYKVQKTEGPRNISLDTSKLLCLAFLF